MGRPNFRRPPMQHPEWLDYVRALECVGCGIWGQQQAHHNIANRYGSSKADDANSLPLYANCHRELHTDWPAWESKHGSQWQHVAETLLQGIRDGVWLLDKKMARALSNGRGSP